MPPGDRPPLVTVFFAFRIMLAIGFFMAAAALFGAFLWWRGKLFETRWYLLVDGADLVDGLRRGDRRLGGDRERPPALDRAGHPAHRRRHLAGDRPGHRASTFALFVVVYGIIFSAGIYFINRLIAKGLDTAATDEPAVSLGGTLAAAGKSTGGEP